VTFALIVSTFAVALTSHVAIVLGLMGKTPRWRALVAVFVPPLGAVWAIREKQRLRAAAWLVAAVAYVALRIASG
jgi:FtsH-binding integral membrane protein